MSDFDERSGIVPSQTSWGRWWQTIEDVNVEVDAPEGTRAKEISCGEFPKTVQPDESIWTLEDGKSIRICLAKTNKTAADCWSSLLIGQYEADLWTHDQMQQKLTLQRFQLENPGMDFSGATITGNYQSGGPDLPS